MIGVFLLNTYNLWRIMAEFRGRNRQRLSARCFCGYVNGATGPSKQLLVAECKNRYPSPSKRSDQFLIRPLNGIWGRQWFAEIDGWHEIPIAIVPELRADSGIKQPNKGRRACKRKSGSWRSQRFWRFLPAVTHCWNRACLALERVLLRPSCWTVTPPRARFWVARAIFCTASKIRRCAELKTNPGAFLRLKSGNGQGALGPLAVFCVGNSAHWLSHYCKGARYV